ISYLEDFGFLKFIRNHLTSIKNNETFLTIKIPLINKENYKQDEIVCSIKVLNYPYFFYKMELI
ncbi:MAG: hypothetical protein ACK5XN_22950, partial [Bacteroidota bacterium]